MAHVTFIHGISNKPAPEQLLKTWLSSLKNCASQTDIEAEGVTCSMVYWADVLYDKPLPSGDFESAQYEGLEMVQVAAATGKLDIGEAADPAESKWINALEQRLGIDDAGEKDAAPVPGTMAEKLERFPLPWAVKQPFLKAFLRDVHHYLFDVEHSPRPGVKYRVQAEIRQRFVDALAAVKTRPHVVVSHSMGTVIAYDCLKRVASCPEIDVLVTAGSPLGIDEIQDKLQPEWTQDEGFPTDKVRQDWINVFDRLDVVAALAPYLASDYRKGAQMVVLDKDETNRGLWRHDIKQYLAGSQLSSAIVRALGI